MSPVTRHSLSLAIAAALAISAGCTAPDATKPAAQQTHAGSDTTQQAQAVDIAVQKREQKDSITIAQADAALVKNQPGLDTLGRHESTVDNQTQAAVSIAPPPPPPMPTVAFRPQPGSSTADMKARGSLIMLESAKTVSNRNAYGAMAAPAPVQAYQPMQAGGDAAAIQTINTENYAKHGDNPVQITAESPVSTFSIDVDTGSYANVRRMLNAGQRPPADSIRAEELLNYFDYAYPMPESRKVPFRVTTEIAAAPWNAKHQLLQIGIQGYDVPKTMLPPSNLVFLIDTSGSMNSPTSCRCSSKRSDNSSINCVHRIG